MREAAYTPLFGLLGYALVGAVDAQDVRVFRAEDVRNLRILLTKVLDAGRDLNMRARDLPIPTKAQVCLGRLGEHLLRLHEEVIPVDSLAFLSSRMQLKADEVLVNKELRAALRLPSLTVGVCPKIAKEAMEACPSDEYVKSKGLEVTQICSEVGALLSDFGALVKDF